MDALYAALQKVRPLSQKHRRALGADIFDLSRLLTTDRSCLRAPYWRNPAYVSAYLYYFLPWNVIRLGCLLASLPLPNPAAIPAPLLLDAGAGPLTVPLALWLARPDWRNLPIRIAALDAARHPLQLGQAHLEELAASTGGKAWKTTLFTGPLPALGCFHCGDGQPWLITAANVLNEVKFRKHAANVDENEDDASPFADLLEAWQPLCHGAKPSLLFVEPGTRLGSGAVMRMREAAMEFGLFAASPCERQGACPLLQKPGSWCHFVFSAQDAPQWLKAISRDAHLFKSSLSLSPLLLTPEPLASNWPPHSLPTRVISQDFEARGAICRYGCNELGLCLLPNSQRLYSGSLCLAAEPGANREIDRKSGALVLAPYSSPKKI